MIFNITNIKKESGAQMDVTYVGPLDNTSIKDMVIINDDISLDGTLTNYEEAILFRGTLGVSYIGKCNRCLEPVTRNLTLKLNERYSTMHSDEDDIYLYEGNYVDLTKAVIDNIIMSLPARLLCSEQCKGICPVCGKNLNLGECNCDKSRDDQEPVNEFGILKDLIQ